MLNHTGSARYAAIIEVARRRRRRRQRRVAPGLGRRRRPPGAPRGPRRPRRDATSTPRSPSAATWSGWTPTSTYAGPGGSAELLGLYFADAGQHLEHRLFADHTAPRTKSHVALQGRAAGRGAHTVWIGNVLIRKVAEGIETYEENRNLVLTDGCQADSIPNLEIETGEIEGAGHASATGALRRRAALLPPLARRLGEGGAAPGRARLLQRPDPQGRRARPSRTSSSTTVEAELAKNVLKDCRRSGGRLMAFERACALDDVPDRRGLAVTLGELRGRRRPRRRRVLRAAERLLPRRGRPQRGRGRATASRVLAARLDASTSAPASPPAFPPPSRSPPSRSRYAATDVYVDTDHHPERSHPLMSKLEIKDLHVTVDTEDGPKEILKGVTLTIKEGETHAIMGPNGSGKSTLAYSIAGHPKYTITGGSVTLDGQDVLAMSVDERARAGLFLAMQYPVEVPGVSVSNFLRTAKTAIDGEAPKLRTWVKDVNARPGAAQPRPVVRPALGQRGLLRRREEAPRDRPARAARPEGRGARRDRLRPRHRRAEDRLRGRQPLPCSARARASC